MFQAEDGIRDLVRSRGLGDVYKRQVNTSLSNYSERTFAISQSFEFPTNYFLKGNKYTKEEEIAFEQYLLKKYELVKQIKSAYFKVLADQSIVKYLSLIHI